MRNSYRRNTRRRNNKKKKYTQRRNTKRCSDVKIVQIKKNACIVLFSNTNSKNKVVKLINNLSNKSRKKQKGGSSITHFITGASTTPKGAMGVLTGIQGATLKYLGGAGAFLLVGATLATIIAVFKSSGLKVETETMDYIEKYKRDEELCKNGEKVGTLCLSKKVGTTIDRKEARERDEVDRARNRAEKVEDMKINAARPSLNPFSYVPSRSTIASATLGRKRARTLGLADKY